MRTELTGTKIGPLILEAQDIEVGHRKELRRYFYSRDIAQNEVLALKRRDGHCMLLWSTLCEEDIKLDRITPAIHCLHVPFSLKWEVDPVTGLGRIANEPMVRSIIRYLKGHGSHYNFDAGTWAFYRRVGLRTIGLYQILKPFCDNDKKYNRAVEHLLEIGLLSRGTLRAYGGPNMLWGKLLDEMNAKIARFGGRLSVNKELTPEQVELWVDSKKARASEKLVTNWIKARRTGYVASDESCDNLGLLTLPPLLIEYMETGRSFTLPAEDGDGAASLQEGSSASTLHEGSLSLPRAAAVPAPIVEEETRDALWVSSGSRVGSLPLRPGEAAAGPPQALAALTSETDLAPQESSLTSTSGGQPSSGPPSLGPGPPSLEAAASRQQSLQSVSSATSLQRATTLPSRQRRILRYSSSLRQQARHSSTATLPDKLSRTPSRAALLRVGGTPEQQGLNDEARRREARWALQRLSMQSMPEGDDLGEMTDFAQDSVMRSSLARYSSLDPLSSTSTTKTCTTTKTVSSALAETVGANQGGENQPAFVGAVSPSLYAAQAPTECNADGLGGEAFKMDDADLPEQLVRARLMPVPRIVSFILGVSVTSWPVALLGYVLILAATVLNIYLPKFQGELVGYLAASDEEGYRKVLPSLVGVTVAMLATRFLGSLVIEVHATRVLRKFTTDLFCHLLSQNLAYFDQVSTSEIIMRSSQDSRVLRSILVVTVLQFMQGLMILVGVVVSMDLSADGTIMEHLPRFALASGVIIIALLAFAAFYAVWARSANLLVRQSMGRLMGFTLEAYVT